MAFNPLRIRPYVTLSDPGELAAESVPPSPQPVSGVVSPPPATAPQPVRGEDDTPAYGIPVAPAAGPWQDGPWQAGPAAAPAPHPAETVRLRAVPAAAATTGGGGGGGGGGGPEERSGSASRRRPLALLVGAAAAVALSGTAVAVWVLPASPDSDTTLLNAKASAPAVSAAAPVAPSASPSRASASPSASASASASKSASPSASPSPSASRSTSSAPPSPSASPSASRSASTPPPAAAPVLRYGDSGPEVEKLQRLLAAEGLYRGRFHGRFDSKVEDALSTFQYYNGIDHQEWGVYGPLTRKALEG
ncbi:peptidoglycan-binding protein [Streptomyces erythrochromogenes]|uniref:peptidoglycan-binding domain-containing protein n=1 Tax=Streptomyces erythrochromogenes TaxID=285574 RepID=UPI003828C1BF